MYDVNLSWFQPSTPPEDTLDRRFEYFEHQKTEEIENLQTIYKKTPEEATEKANDNLQKVR